MKEEKLQLILQKYKGLYYYEQLYAKKRQSEQNGQMSRNIKSSKTESRRSRKPK